MYESTKKAIKKYKSGHKSFSLLFSKIFFDRIKKQADADDISVSELLRRGAELYIEKRAPEMAQERAQRKAEQEAKREALAKAKADKKKAEQEKWQKEHGYNPETDAPKIKTSHSDVVMPEPLEPIDYRQKLAEAEESRQQAYLTAEQQKAEAERERIEQEAAQRVAFEAAKQILKQQAEQEQKPKKKIGRDGYTIKEQEHEPVQEQEKVHLRQDAVRPVDMQKQQATIRKQTAEVHKHADARQQAEARKQAERKLIQTYDPFGLIRKDYEDYADYIKELKRRDAVLHSPLK